MEKLLLLSEIEDARLIGRHLYLKLPLLSNIMHFMLGSARTG